MTTSPSSGHIILGGTAHPVANPVQTWLDTGLTFDTDHAPEREHRIRWGVLHWTGGGKRVGLKGAKQIHRTLERRGLSVEFAITDDGTIWQFVDPVFQRCAHAGRINKISLGVEVSGPGWLRRYFGLRKHYQATVHGWTTKFIDYLPEQQQAVNALADALGAAGVVLPMVTTEPYERLLTSHFYRGGGWCGHLHCDRLRKKHPKCDPGPAPLEALEAHLEKELDL
jgi:hypothetical protein